MALSPRNYPTIQVDFPVNIIQLEVNENMAKKVQFVETVLRDANQSLIATRLPALPE